MIGLCFVLKFVVVDIVTFISALAPELQANRKSCIKFTRFFTNPPSSLGPPHPFRDGSGMSGSGPCDAAVDCRGPHVLPHLLWLCGLPAGEHLPAANSK